MQNYAFQIPRAGKVSFFMPENRKVAHIFTTAVDGTFNYDKLPLAAVTEDAVEALVMAHARELFAEPVETTYSRITLDLMISFNFNMGVGPHSNKGSDGSLPRHAQLQQEICREAIGSEVFEAVKLNADLNDHLLINAMIWLSRGNRARRAECLTAMPLSVVNFLGDYEHSEKVDSSPDFLGDYAAIHKLDRRSARLLQRLESRFAAFDTDEREKIWRSGLVGARILVGSRSIRATTNLNILECLKATITHIPDKMFRDAKTADELTNVLMLGRALAYVYGGESAHTPTLGLLHGPIKRYLGSLPNDGIYNGLTRLSAWVKVHGADLQDWTANCATLLDAAGRHRRLCGEIDMPRAERIAEDLIAGRDIGQDDGQWFEACLVRQDFARGLAGSRTNPQTPSRQIDRLLTEKSGFREIKALQTRWHHRVHADTAVLKDVRGDSQWKPVIGEIDLGRLTASEITTAQGLRDLGRDQDHCVGSYLAKVVNMQGGAITLIFAIKDRGGEVQSTCEITGRRSRDGYLWRLTQNRARSNEDPSDEADIAARQIIEALENLSPSQVQAYQEYMALGTGDLREKLLKSIAQNGANIWRADALKVIEERLIPVLPKSLTSLPFGSLLDKVEALRDLHAPAIADPPVPSSTSEVAADVDEEEEDWEPGL